MPNQYKPTSPLDKITPHILCLWKAYQNDREIVRILREKHIDTEQSIHDAMIDIHQMYPKAGIQEVISLLFYEKNMSVSRTIVSSYFTIFKPELVRECKARCLKRRHFCAVSVNNLFTINQHDKWLRFGLGLHTRIEPFSGCFETVLDHGVNEGLYDVGNTLQNMVFRWVFIPWLQCELDAYHNRVNNTAKQHNRNKMLPHGVPSHIYDSPQDFNTLDFKVIIDHDGVDQVRKLYINPSHVVFDIVPPTLGNFIQHCYDQMGCPEVTHSSVWTVYRNLLSVLQLADNIPPTLLDETEPNEDDVPLLEGCSYLPFCKESNGPY
ncbi:hypothetical protein CY34DRAFT_27241 [Suillus luteus UH-Slu-Lm8-n1]|uniref:Uncharacterized protein n=1 Tax=Suillus luteus UH-Slu-Lm8-n1 TaxID=930992 RepID=A0A0C9Z4D1_9AGAM|nr:hypothetical protein CY34DRAFT_27241 [Suillus luteus UH-Slu-Lm8-n1]